MNTDGGPEFTVPDTHHPDGQIQYGTNGMSLRDWFAGQALMGWAAGRNRPMEHEACEPASVARSCYVYADAMLRARERGLESDGDEAWFAKQPDACVSVSDDVVMASSGRHYLASGSTRSAALRALRAKVEGGGQ